LSLLIDTNSLFDESSSIFSKIPIDSTIIQETCFASIQYLDFCLLLALTAISGLGIKTVQNVNKRRHLGTKKACFCL
jgi:hypothetical protein